MELSATPAPLSNEPSALVEYIELQGSAEMVTKSELVQRIREGGQAISDRNLAYYTSAGLIPPAVRVGSRGGAYPAIVVEQLSWVISARAADVSIDGIKELLPLWRLLVRGRRDDRIDLAEVELVARTHNLSLEANYRVPYLFSEVFRCVCSECLMGIEWVLKDGTTFHHTDDTPLTLSFVVGKVNEDTGSGEVVAWTQMALPNMGAPALGSPTTIMLGVPVGVEVRPLASEHRRRPRRTPSRQEALPLT